MISLIAPTHTTVDRILLSRRIREVMEERGKHYSITAMSNRIGINRETLRLMINGERDIYNYELEKIALDLKVSVKRLLQDDTHTENEIFTYLLEHREEPYKALDLAKFLSRASLGLTEKCCALYRLARANFFNHNYEESYNCITAAHQKALQIKEIYGEEKILYDVLCYMVTVYTAKQDFVNASKALAQVEPMFQSDPNKFAALSYLHAKTKESLGELESAKTLAYVSYDKAKGLLEKSIPALENDLKSQLVARKDLVKNLIVLGEVERAEEEIVAALKEIEEKAEHFVVKGKLLFLLSRVKDESTFAELVVDNEGYSKEIRLFACKFLMNFFGNKGDSRKYIHYYKIAEELDPKHSDILFEGAM